MSDRWEEVPDDLKFQRYSNSPEFEPPKKKVAKFPLENTVRSKIFKLLPDRKMLRRLLEGDHD